MATIRLFNALPDYQWWPDYFEPGNGGTAGALSATQYKWTNADGSTVTLRGTGFLADTGLPVAGVVNSITVRDSAGVTLLTFTGLTADLVDIYYDAFGYQPGTLPNSGPEGHRLLSSLMIGNDTIIGSSNSDDIGGSRNTGDDLIQAGGGNDFITGDAGNDTIDGGAGENTLSYVESFWDFTATRGITVDVTAGTVADCWGGLDHFSNISDIEGSTFADTFFGGTNNDNFSGGRGADTFFGGGGNGFDELYYWRDESRGGTRGIVVNLGTGKIKDGWGQTDTVSGIESVVGTDFADSYFGGALDDEFIGGGGLDIYNGKGGSDNVNFSWGPALNGARVNMNLTTGQVLDDGFGNVETLVSIERLDGNELGDNFLGNNAANGMGGDEGDDVMSARGGNDRLQGDAGADTLTGGTGADEFHYSRREGNDPWGDTITDFVSLTDFLSFETGDFAGMDTVVRFRNGSSAGGTGSWFFFQNATDGLFWDADGTGTGAAVRVATLTGLTTISASDIDLF